MSSAPPARWFASAAGCTESPHDASITDTLTEIHRPADRTPVVGPSDLWTLDDVLVTPHAAALSARENEQQLQSGGLGTAPAMVASSN